MPPRLMMGEYTNEFGAGGGSGGIVGTGAYTPPPLEMGVLGQYGNMGVNFLNPNAGALADNILSGAMQNVGMPTMPTQTAMQNFGAKAGNFLSKAGGVLSKGIGLLGGAAPAAAGLFGLLGLGSSMRNKPKDINVDFSFDMERAQYNPNSALQQNMGSLRGLGGTFQQQATDMLNPGSTYNQRQFQMLRRNIGDQSSQSINNMNAAMASRGMMGIGGAYDAIANRQAGDQFAQGQQNIINQGTQLASAMGNLAMGAYGQAGQLAAGIDSRTLQNQQFNAQNQNTYNQYLKMADYNQQIQNQNAQAAYRNSQSNNLFNLAGSFLGLGA